MSEDLEKEVRRAERAKQIINDEVFQAAVSSLRDALLLGIRQSAFKDEKLREKLCARYALLEELVTQLQAVMETGAMAKEQLSMIEKAKEFLNG